MSPSTALFADFEEFSSRQLRTLVMEGIEAEVRRQEVVLEAALMDRIEDIVRSANQQLFQQWREHQSLTQLEPGPSSNAALGPTDVEGPLTEPAAELAAMVVPPPEMDFDHLLSNDFTLPATATDPVHSAILSRADSTYGSSQTSDKAVTNGGAAAGPAHHSQPQTQPVHGELLPTQSTYNGRWDAVTAPQNIDPGSLPDSVLTSSFAGPAFWEDLQDFPDSIPQTSPTTAAGTLPSSSQWDKDGMHQEGGGIAAQFEYWAIR
ncbi:hypothetical protein DIS24_g8244 [Lasiodiplodia hormozganensis]|uniref:Uncharacterized protein n=1 Tax=Lasiodiplodia hormozganensis TaxID=869390 RepID=A0AA40CNN2_9PEZI|nr:hypothetical protein DIS24_g8244 [Lasiodiplodia hormozganensis]